MVADLISNGAAVVVRSSRSVIISYFRYKLVYCRQTEAVFGRGGKHT